MTTMWALVAITVAMSTSHLSAMSQSTVVELFDSRDRCEVTADYLNTARVAHSVEGRRAVCIEVEKR